jgi:hypothetical protein
MKHAHYEKRYIIMNAIIKATEKKEFAKAYTLTGINKIDEIVTNVAVQTSKTEEGGKALAKSFHELRTQHTVNKDNPNYKYSESKFPELVDSLFNGEYSGATAHKYAKTYEMFALSSQPEYVTAWNFFTLGKLNALKSIVTIEAKKSDKKEEWEMYISVGSFLAYYGERVNDMRKAELEKWIEENSKIAERRERAKGTFTDEEIEEMFPYVGEKPDTAPEILPVPTDTNDTEGIKAHAESYNNYWQWVIDTGAKVLSLRSDSNFKSDVAGFIDSYKPETPETAEDTAEEKKEPESPETVLARLIADMGTYAETFGDKVPAWYSSTLEKLKARQAK